MTARLRQMQFFDWRADFCTKHSLRFKIRLLYGANRSGVAQR